LLISRGSTTAEKLRGTKVWVPKPIGLGVGRGRVPPVPLFFENSDAKSCILVTILAVKFLAF